MPDTARPQDAAELLVHGTYALRRALDRLTQLQTAALSEWLVAGQRLGDAPAADQVAGRDQADDLPAATSVGRWPPLIECPHTVRARARVPARAGPSVLGRPSERPQG